jgi:hypothetical protein
MLVSEESHVLNCDEDTCPVCHSKLVEWKQHWDWVWFTIVTHTDRQNENHTLGEYNE